MRKNEKSFIKGLTIVILLLVLASSLVNLDKPIPGQIADVFEFSDEDSLNEMISAAEKFNKSIFLPFELPNKLEYTALYLKESPFIAILVYSAEGNKDYKTAELTIEISISTSPPTYNDLFSKSLDSEYETALLINDWPVLVNERASTGSYVETKEKYGDHFLLVITYIGGMRYLIGCRTLTKSESIILVRNMDLLTS